MKTRSIPIAMAVLWALALTSMAFAQHDPGSRKGDQGVLSEEIESRAEADEARLRDREEWQKQVQRQAQVRRESADPRTAQSELKDVRDMAIAEADPSVAETAATAGEAKPVHEEMSGQVREHLDSEAARKVDPEAPDEDAATTDEERTAERIDQ